MTHISERRDEVSVVLGRDMPELRQAVQRLCAGYPDEYWRQLDEAQAYPTDFVNDLTKAASSRR